MTPSDEPRVSTGNYVNDVQNAEAAKWYQQAAEAEQRLADREREQKWVTDQKAQAQRAEADKAKQQAEIDGYVKSRGAMYAPPKPAARQVIAPPGKQLGVMAQDVEKTPMGAQAVQPVGGLKTITPTITGPVLAGLARLNERLENLEGKKKPTSTSYAKPGHFSR
jgi:ATPase subunit of ABC transporter with duplicated ATPase domains